MRIFQNQRGALLTGAGVQIGIGPIQSVTHTMSGMTIADELAKQLAGGL